MNKFGKSAPEMLSDGLAQSVLVSRSKVNGMTVAEWPGMASSKFVLESMIWKSPKESLWMWMKPNFLILLDGFQQNSGSFC
jgi:hypothetical protein